LSYSFNLTFGSEQWNFLQNQFEQAFALKDSLNETPHHNQNRQNNTPEYSDEMEKNKQEKLFFYNEPDSNFDLLPNRLWADKIRLKWKKSASDKTTEIPVQIGENLVNSDNKRQYFDRCQDDEICIYQVSVSSTAQMKEIIAVAENDEQQWRRVPVSERLNVLNRTADNLSRKRGDMTGCMAAVTGKTFYEGDVEVSEAIDFCRYYPLTINNFSALKTVKISPKGVILVIAPWNFPLAIPVGGVAAALSGGNTVILKPATAAFPVAWEFAQCFWEAGLPKSALQVVCPDRDALNYLTAHHSVKHIVLTGGADTAFRLLQNNPACPLSAETGGKNAIIVTAKADRDHAIQNIVTSAFSNAGQKCSACSLLILEKEVYNDPEFKSKLTDAVTSLNTGSVWDGGVYVGPMIDSQNEKLLHAIHNLEDKEWWLVKPEFIDKNKFMLKPCVKWGVKPGSFSFVNELFAPLLSVVCADNLLHAIQLANSSEYGLTAGLQTLDESEIALWKSTIEAGNLYINRGTTGAIVSRQPFGGLKLSAFGAGIKAGGPNYTSCFVNIVNTKHYTSENAIGKFEEWKLLLTEGDRKKFMSAVASYLKNYDEIFSVERDIYQLAGEENTFRYLPLRNILFRIQQSDELVDILMVVAAATISKNRLTISLDSNNSYKNIIKQIAGSQNVDLQTDPLFIESIKDYERIRSCTPNLLPEVFDKVAELGVYIATRPPLAEGRLELLHYLKEQSIAYEYHRYGSIFDPERKK
jgi:RHH-type proline utilization regulon transcriptional repressor/proline dehydrogenase/delta 1-pyrroline-5-carboxylate dehydrogenase